MIFLDVVMETDDAGLRLARVIREEIGNRATRIILRTGQPGQAPERDIIIDYDINDYKAKSELTSQKLFTATVAALRSYEDICTIEASRNGLQMIIDSSTALFQERSVALFAKGVLTQLSALLGISAQGILCVRSRRRPAAGEGDATVIAGSGTCAEAVGGTPADGVPPDVAGLIAEALAARHSVLHKTLWAIYMSTAAGNEIVTALHLDRPTGEIDRALVELFCNKVSVGFDNLHLYDELDLLYRQLKRSHQATVRALAALAEHKDTDTGDHVVRVENTTTELARRLAETGRHAAVIDDMFLENIGLASVLHDVGKIGVPDGILRKPGRTSRCPPASSPWSTCSTLWSAGAPTRSRGRSTRPWPPSGMAPEPSSIRGWSKPFSR